MDIAYNKPSHCSALGRSVGCALLLAALHLADVQAGAFHNPYGMLPTNATAGDRSFAEYFRMESQKLATGCLPENLSLEDWKTQKPKLRQGLFEMLGLDPLPPRGDLKATVTGTLEQPDFTVEKLHFQSMPGLYVTANLYLPKNLTKPAPAILYLCGHAPVKTNGVSYGCKVAYQHHGIWFARNGYVCLMLDTVELGEIEGVHHGTYSKGMWWWNSRGYTPAGAEAWNAMRALDYLETRPEVDKSRFGVTGRSGGGAYSWWLAALDERVKVACPVAGMTDLENYVVDGTVEGHCDCMFMVNTYRWDYPAVAALIAPRPLLICNSDKDTIFPLDGVVRLHEKVRHMYDLGRASDKLGLLVTEGPHHDTQELQLPVFRWFNRFLKNETPLVEMAAVPLFSGQQLKVLDKVPSDSISSECYEHFTKLAVDGSPVDSKTVLADLKQKTFGGWPDLTDPPRPRQLTTTEADGVRLVVYEFDSQPGETLRFYVVRPIETAPQTLCLEVLDETSWQRRLTVARTGFASALRDELQLAGSADSPGLGTTSVDLDPALSKWLEHIRDERTAWITFAPRGVGLSRVTQERSYHTQVRRRFMLLGQTLAGMQSWDVRRVLQAVRQCDGIGALPMRCRASEEMTEVVSFAALFEPGISSLALTIAPRVDKEAPDFLNWSRIITPGQLLTLIRERCLLQIGADTNN
jgi:dienelactone hydrolase